MRPGGLNPVHRAHIGIDSTGQDAVKKNANEKHLLPKKTKKDFPTGNRTLAGRVRGANPNH